MKRDNWPVGQYSIDSNTKRDECVYCGAKIGEEHKKGCIIRKRTIKLRMTMDFVTNVPEFWDEEQINFYFNESSWRASSIIHMLKERDATQRCLCDCTSFEYIGEATEGDEGSWGITKVEALKS